MQCPGAGAQARAVMLTAGQHCPVSQLELCVPAQRSAAASAWHLPPHSVERHTLNKPLRRPSSFDSFFLPGLLPRPTPPRRSTGISLYYQMSEESLKGFESNRKGNDFLVNLIDSPGEPAGQPVARQPRGRAAPAALGALRAPLPHRAAVAPAGVGRTTQEQARFSQPLSV